MNEEQFEQLILNRLSDIASELREFRLDFSKKNEENESRIKTLEVKIDDLYGGYQPGRVQSVETKISKLENFRWWVLGVMGVCSVIGSLIVSVIERWLK